MLAGDVGDNNISGVGVFVAPGYGKRVFCRVWIDEQLLITADAFYAIYCRAYWGYRPGVEVLFEIESAHSVGEIGEDERAGRGSGVAEVFGINDVAAIRQVRECVSTRGIGIGVGEYNTGKCIFEVHGHVRCRYIAAGATARAHRYEAAYKARPVRHCAIGKANIENIGRGDMHGARSIVPIRCRPAVGGYVSCGAGCAAQELCLNDVAASSHVFELVIRRAGRHAGVSRIEAGEAAIGRVELYEPYLQ